MRTTYEELIALLMKDYKIPSESLTLETPFVNLDIDSLGMTELLFNIEDKFKIKMPYEPIELPTIGHVVAYIDALVAVQHLKENNDLVQQTAT